MKVTANGVLVLAALATSGLAYASQSAETVKAAHVRFAVFDNRQYVPDGANFVATAGITVGGAPVGLRHLGSGPSLGDRGVTGSYREVASNQEVASNVAEIPKDRIALSAGAATEPATFTMILSGLGLMVYLARRRKKGRDLLA